MFIHTDMFTRYNTLDYTICMSEKRKDFHTSLHFFLLNTDLDGFKKYRFLDFLCIQIFFVTLGSGFWLNSYT